MSRVFVIQNQHRMNNGTLQPKFDLQPAEKFGELHYLLSPTARPFSSEHVIGELRDKLRDITCEDYLLLIGNPILIGFAVAIASWITGGKIKVLQWDGKLRAYIAVTADLRFQDSPWKTSW
jgi:hypothetical protein